MKCPKCPSTVFLLIRYFYAEQLHWKLYFNPDTGTPTAKNVGGDFGEELYCHECGTQIPITGEIDLIIENTKFL